MEGKIEIKICVGSSCFAKGNKNNLDFVQEYLKVNNLNAVITIKGQLCTKQCDKGPVVVIGGETYTHVSKAVLINLLEEKLEHEISRSKDSADANE